MKKNNIKWVYVFMFFFLFAGIMAWPLIPEEEKIKKESFLTPKSPKTVKIDKRSDLLCFKSYNRCKITSIAREDYRPTTGKEKSSV